MEKDTSYEQKIEGQTVIAGERNTVTVVSERTAPPVVPFMAPRKPPYKLVGRSDTLQKVKERLFSEGKVAIDGLPGVGKTAVALELAYDKDVQEHFPDGSLWAGLGRGADVNSHLVSIGINLGILPQEMARLTSIEERAKAVKRAIGRRHMLLVVDDVWEFEAATALEVIGPNCGYILTTRLPVLASDFAGSCVVTIHELSGKDGVTLLSQFVPEIVKTEQEKAVLLVQLVGGLPLAIILMGKYLHRETHAGQSRRLKKALLRLQKAKERLSLKQFQTHPDHHPSLPLHTPLSLITVIGISSDSLDEASRYALQALSVLPPKPNNFSEEAALEVSSGSLTQLDRLVDHGLLECMGPARYALHQTISDFGKEELKDKTAYERMVKFFVNFAEKNAKNHTALCFEASNILTALCEASIHRMNELHIQGIISFFEYLETRGLYDVAETHLRLAQRAAVSIGDTLGLVTILLNLGRMAGKRGDFASAEKFWLKGLRLSREAEYPERTCDLLLNIGGLHISRGDFDKAEQCLQEGLALARSLKDDERISKLLNNLGSIPFRRGDFAEAEVCWREALKLAKNAKNQLVINHPLTNLGLLEVARENFQKAQNYLDSALQSARNMQYCERIGDIMLGLGIIEYSRGNLGNAKDLWLEGLEIASRIGNKETVCHLSSNLALLEYDCGDLFKAETYWLENLKAALEMEEPQLITVSSGNLGGLALKRGDFERAEDYLQQSLTHAQNLGNPYFISGIKCTLGELALKRGDFERAEDYLQQSLTHARNIPNRQLIVESLSVLGRIECERGNFGKGGNYLLEGWDLALKSGNAKLIGTILIEWGESNLRQQRTQLAYSAFFDALNATRTCSKELFALALYGLGRVAAEQGNTMKARTIAWESLVTFENMGHYLAREVADWIGKLVE